MTKNNGRKAQDVTTSQHGDVPAIAWSYSVGDEGQFHGQYTTDAEAMEHGHEALFELVAAQGDEFADTPLWIGKSTPAPKLGDFFDASSFLGDAMCCAAGDYGGDCADSWEPNCVPREDLESLTLIIRVQLNHWADRLEVQPDFYHMAGIERVPTDPEAVIRESRARKGADQ